MNKKLVRGFISGCNYGNVIVLLLLSIAPVWAQTQSGSLQIRVVDSNQKTVTGATVRLTNKNSGQSRSAMTSPEGLAVFEGIAPGIYDIVATKSGFAAAALTDVQIGVGQQKSIDLEFGLRLSFISLEAEKEAREEQISALPNLNNDLTPLLQTVPGSIATGPAALGRVIIDGKGNDQQTVRLDGVDFTILVDLPSADAAIDALGSFQKPEVAGDLDNSSTRKGPFAPIGGPGTGSVVETVTFAGGSKADWVAQLYGEHRNDALNARNFFDSDGKNALRRTRFGGKVSRRLGQKSLLYFGYDGTRGRSERNVYEAIPNDAVCRCSVGPLAQTLRGFLPAGTSVVAGASLNPDFVVARRRNRTSVASNATNLRFDHFPFVGAKNADGQDLPKAGNTFTFRFTRQATENIVPDGVTGRRQRQAIVFANALVSNFWAREGSTHRIRFGFNETRAHVDTQIPVQPGPSLAESLITVSGSVKTVGLPGQLATVPISNATLGGLIKGIGRGFTLSPVSLSLGYDGFWEVAEDDELRVGVETRVIRMDFDRLGGLTYAFPNVAAVRAGTPATTTFLSDLSKASPFTTASGVRHARQEYFMGYIQMVSPQGNARPNPTNGKTEPRLILTYGVRYDYFSSVRERDHRAVIVDPLTSAILPRGTSFYRTAKFNFQPRFGLVYRLDDGGFLRNTVLRAGVGVYSGVPRTGDLLLPIESDRFSTGITGGTLPVNPADVTGGFIANPDTRQFQPVAFAREYKALERLYKWELQLSQMIRGYDLGLLYTGNIGRNLPLGNIANRIVSVSTNPDATKPAIVLREFDIVRSGQVFQPFGEFFFRTSEGRSSYNGLTVFFKRNPKAESSPNPSSWLRQAVMSLNVQYTLSWNVGNVSGAVASNHFNHNADFGYNAADARHNFRASAVYDLWTARNDRPTKFLSGWKIMPSLRASSGFPVIVRLDRPDVVYIDASGAVFGSPALGRTAIINTPGGGGTGGARVPDLIPGVNPYLSNDRELLNPAAFAIPLPGKFGNLKRGALRGPATFSVDLGLRRNLFNYEKKSVKGEFQVEIFNLFNRTNFLNPSALLPNVLGTSQADNQLQPGVGYSRASAGDLFGVMTAAENGRLIQFSMTLRFNEGFTK